MEALLEVKNLSIGIQRVSPSGKVQVLSSVEDISFEIYPGEILGIVGESGSGKTLTALSIPRLLGDDKIVSQGSIRLRLPGGELELQDLKEEEIQAIRGKEISMVFQEAFSSLNPLQKIGPQVAEPLRLQGETDRALMAQRTRELLTKLKLPDPDSLIHRYPHELSGGMRQRVMIALAAISRPRLLIADEPTTALDQNTQGQILSLLKEINQDYGTAILFISHDLSLVKNFCHRVLVMYSGRFLEQGKTEDIFSRPAHEYTKSLLGAIPDRTKRGSPLSIIQGKIPSLEEGRPPGCPFHPRCQRASPECMGDFPPRRGGAQGHWTHCIREDL
ncbi:MAG: ABC transporter ATP-binding protein [Treponema sp.]|nr:ABC transporter ATP-binding protein [Treponema sp.]